MTTSGSPCSNTFWCYKIKKKWREKGEEENKRKCLTRTAVLFIQCVPCCYSLCWQLGVGITEEGRFLMAQIFLVKNLGWASDFWLCIRKVFLLPTCSISLPKGDGASKQSLPTSPRLSGYRAVPAVCLQGTCTGHGCVFPHLQGDDGWWISWLFY